MKATQFIITISCLCFSTISVFANSCPPPTIDFLANPFKFNAAYRVKNRSCSPDAVRIVNAAPEKTTQHDDLGTITVRIRNGFGIHRQRATIDDLLREKAAHEGANTVVIERSNRDPGCVKAKIYYIHAK